MILRSIKVEGWKCFPEEVAVGPFVEGLNILYAPNGTGKSTLFEALRRGILDGHTAKGEEFKSLRPWGRELNPTVVAEVFHEGVEYKFTKRFLMAIVSRLERKEGDRFVSLSEGREADERIRTLFLKSPAQGKGSKTENWGLAQVLWAPQSNLVMPALSADLVTSIRGFLGVQVAGSPLEGRIEQVYESFFTGKGEPRTGTDLKRLQGELEDARQKLKELLGKYQAFEESSRRVEDLRGMRAQAQRDSEAITSALGETRRRAGEYQELMSEKGRQEGQAKAAEARHKEIKARLEAIGSARAELKSAEMSVEKLGQDLPLIGREVAEREAAEAAARAALEDLRKGREKVDKAQSRARAAGVLTRAQEREGAAKRLLDQAKKALKEHEDLKGLRSRLVAPDAKAMREILKVLKLRDDAQTKLDAALISLEVVPEKDIGIEVVAGEKTGKRRLAADAPVEIKGMGEVVVAIPGVARLRARGPSESAETLRAERDKAGKKLEELTRVYGGSDIGALEVLKEKADDLDRQVEQAKTRLDSILAGRTVEEIEQERSKAGAEMEVVLEQHADWRKKGPEAKRLEEEADAIQKTFIAAVDPAERSWEKARDALSVARERKAKAEAGMAEQEKQIEIIRRRIQGLTSDGLDDVKRNEGLDKAALEWHAAKTVLGEIEGKLSVYGVDPREDVKKLELRLKAAVDTARMSLESEKIEEGSLLLLEKDGSYSALAMAEEKVARLEAETAREKLQMDAIRLLHGTVAVCRSETLAGVTAPVESIVTRNLMRIAGPRFGRVRLGETFEPVHVVPREAEVNAAPGELSGGEQEQLYFVTRLALAEVLSRDERQLVVLDDVLAFTDSGRLNRALAILEEAAQQNQVVVLTCRPEWYRGISTANFIDLEEIVRGSRQ
ncbi:MAG: hypothetical protein PHE84_01790 [bacterium]|nr:hypothetical protein [bacterium]